MRSKWIVTGWMLMGWTLITLALVACRQEESRSAPAASSADAGSIRIEKKTETLKQGEEEAVVHTPVLEGGDPAVLGKVQESIAAGVKEATGSSPAEWKAEFQGGNGWLDEIDYEVKYHRDDLLSLTYWISGTGAYPSGQSAEVNVDLRTGRLLSAKDLFRAGSLAELAAKVDAMRAAAVEKAVQEHRAQLKEYEMTEEDLAATMEPAKQSRFGVDDLNRFRLDEKGVTFVYDFDFPHVTEALEPEGEYFLSYEELRPYVDPGGPLSRMVR